VPVLGILCGQSPLAVTLSPCLPVISLSHHGTMTLSGAISLPEPVLMKEER